MSEHKLSPSELKVHLENNQKTSFKVTKNIPIIKQRRTVQYKSDRTTYAPLDQIVIPFGSSTEWIFGPTSYLHFKLKILNGGALGVDVPIIGRGSACNIFDSITITGKNGIIIEEIRDLANLVQMRDTWTTPDSYLNEQALVMGYDAGASFSNTTAEYGTSTNNPDVCVGMGHLSGFMSSDKLIPISIMGGLELRLTLNPANKVAHNATSAPDKYEVSDVQLVTDNFRMDDAVLKVTNDMSNTGVLRYAFDTFNWNRSPVLATTSTTINLEKSLGKVLSVYSKVRVAPGANEGKVDSVASATATAVIIHSYQYRVGSEAFPNFPINNTAVSYMETLQSFNSLCNCVRTPFVGYAKFLDGYRVLGMQLERDPDNTDFLSGISTNNKNSVSLELTTNVDCVVTSWVHFVRMLSMSKGELQIEQ